MTEKKKPEKQESIKHLPAIKYLRSTYAPNTDSNDQKAVSTFRMFETREKLQRLRNELQLVKESKVAPEICDLIIGKPRMGRYGSYEGWAKLMLLWIAQAKR